MYKFLIFLLFVPLSQNDAKPRQKRMVNGIPAEVGSFSFLASLRYKETNHHICGAAIISEDFLITAAHCIEDRSPNATEIYAGSVDQDHGGTNYDIYEFIIHENYITGTSENDIGLIRLTKTMRIGSHMEIIEFLPRHLNVSAGDEATAAGWGYHHYYKPKASHCTIKKKSNRLQYLDGTILSDEECSNKTGLKIGPGEICLDSEDDKTTCYGDSGSPLVYTYKDNHFILGVLSSGLPEDCKPNSDEVTIYANVSHYLDWIHAHMKEGKEGNLLKGDYSNLEDEEEEEGMPMENSNSEKSEKTHNEENKLNSQEAEETISSLKKVILSIKILIS